MASNATTITACLEMQFLQQLEQLEQKYVTEMVEKDTAGPDLWNKLQVCLCMRVVCGVFLLLLMLLLLLVVLMFAVDDA